MKKQLIVFTLLILMFSCTEKNSENDEISSSNYKKNGMVEIDYREIKMTAFVDTDGNYIINEEILLNKKEVKELDFFSSSKTSNYSINEWEQTNNIDVSIWPTTNLTFRIDPDIPNSQKTLIRQAVTQWGNLTPMKFTETTQRENVYFKKVDNGCNPSLGQPKNNETAIVNLSQTCDIQSIIHEIGHIVGMTHEHQRITRQNYISFPSNTFSYIKKNYSNLYPSVVRNLQKERSTLNDPYNFDIGSAMMYGSFPRNNIPLRDPLANLRLSILSLF